ncbi:MAG TPA: GGDEF domain-containing protein [Edaphobacter sp.]|nr:GGDEF domain-containing protein [Edaphobacter sp.]
MLSLMVAILGCLVVSRGRKEVRGLNWLIGTLCAALAAAALLYGRSRIPDFFSIVVANELMLAALVLLHQAVTAILGSSRRCLWLSLGLAGALLVALLHYTYVSNDLGARVLARTAAVTVQILTSIVVLFRHKDPVLRSPIRVALWALAGYCMMQMTRLVLTVIWPPSPDLLHPDAVQAFFSFVNCIMGLSMALSVLWLALWSQRYELQTMAFSDALTGLMNRRAFDEMMEREMRGQRRGEPLVLLLIDIDSFKAINDEYGHLAGDEVIRQVGRVLQANLRADDTVSRYGGEEFVMLLRDLRLDRAEAIAERLRLQIAGFGGPEAIGVTVSIGLAVHDPGDTFASLLKRSDDALYCAKRSGRNRVSMALV